ncbi:HNH endonuclease signature motif containing protein [Sciscionella marina]|uniref:HNH endonuclease signature motif containing protein n=1 Tax=Sciscionella marina TaxID=508770 RepID=UPI000379EADD|nr:HNH endonuclease signature motif containing protein [Sciscionella marina]
MSTGEISAILSSRERVDRFVEQAAVARRAEAEMLDQAAQLEKDGAPIEFGYGSMTRMLEDTLRISRAEARRMADRVHDLFGALGISGEPIPADLPNTANAYLRGELGAEHVDRIRRFATELPADVLTGNSWPIAEKALAETATEVGPRGLARPIRELHALLDPDGQQPDDRELARPARQVWLEQWQNDWTIHGRLDYETGLKLRSVFDALGTPDRRTQAERDADAFAEVVRFAANPENLPENGSEPFTIMVTMTEQALREGIGQATTMDGTTIPATQLRRIACDAGHTKEAGGKPTRRNTDHPIDNARLTGGRIGIYQHSIPTVLGSAGEVLDMGCRDRTAPPKLRRRLIARDRGCAHPDCDKPPNLTQAHHIQHHASGGLTTQDNMVLLCAHHHRMIHQTEWTVRIHNGTPEFTPPEYRTREPHSPGTVEVAVRTAASPRG